MMECKKALAEAGGDLAKAEEILRVKLGNKASKAAARIAAEGVVAVHIDGPVGAIVEVNSETDFVAKNDDFLKFAKDLAALVARNDPADVAALSALPLAGSTVETVRTALVGKIGENMAIRRFARVEAQGQLASYVHGGSKITPARHQGATANSPRTWRCTAASKPNLWMPVALRASYSMPSGASHSRRREAGKPEAMLEKIARNCAEVPEGSDAAGQVFVKAEDGNRRSEQLLKSRGEGQPLRAVRRWRGHREEAERLRRRGSARGCAWA
jgi:elongation factor Ts